jgi:hypothetical protein
LNGRFRGKRTLVILGTLVDQVGPYYRRKRVAKLGVTTEWSPSLAEHMAREEEMVRPERLLETASGLFQPCGLRGVAARIKKLTRFLEKQFSSSSRQAKYKRAP